MSDTRLIERWLPIAALGEESVRERRISLSGKVLPPNNSLHVWWARRPLVASRAAILASILPADANQEQFLHALGIHGDPIAAKRLIEVSKRKGEPIGEKAYGYPRAFRYSISDTEAGWVRSEMDRLGLSAATILDPTAGGGSIPFESVRLGLRTLSNDLNPVAALVQRATVEYPQQIGAPLLEEFKRLTARFLSLVEPRGKGLYPKEDAGTQVLGYLWARTVACPYCSGIVPLSPYWKLDSAGAGVVLQPQLGMGPGKSGRHVRFEITNEVAKHSAGTVSGGDAKCPFSDCERVFSGDEIKQLARDGKMGEQLYAVAVKRRVSKAGKTGRVRESWEAGFRAPQVEDDVAQAMVSRFQEKLPEWEALDYVPNEALPMATESWTHGNTPAQYGATGFRDLFSPRQLLAHGIGVEVFREMLAEERQHRPLSSATEAAFVYLAVALDKMLTYNCRSSRWDQSTATVRNLFERHDFSFKWSYAEFAVTQPGTGFKWVMDQTGNWIEQLIELTRPDMRNAGVQQGNLALSRFVPPEIIVSCRSGDALDHLSSGSVDCVVMDPPYYDNVMYAELADFFYVWLKRTAGHVLPDLFRRQLTDKDSEAIANPARFSDEKGARALAGRDYQERMSAIFAECRRVLKANGIMVLMFTHKATGAWDALTKGLMEAGFTITASWPVNTEAETSLHIRNKAAANSTIFLVCRPRDAANAAADRVYWEDVEPLVAKAVRENVRRFQEAGILGVDLYLACFGPALEEFSKHWPLKRGTPRAKPEEVKRRKQSALFEDPFDPYAVTPEDALDAARREVKQWKLEQLTHMKANSELDPVTSWFVLAWDAFRAPAFDYDEALRLARAVGVDLDRDVIGWLGEKKGSDVRLWDSSARAAKGVLGPVDGSRAMIDAIHHAAFAARTRNLDIARETLAQNHTDRDPKFFVSLEAMLEVLPVSKSFSGIELEGDAASQGSDFEALENLRRLAFSDKVDKPTQLQLQLGEAAA